MNILSLLTNHIHYWGIPHERPSDKRLVQICYECGAERVMKIDLRPSWEPKIEAEAPRRENKAA